MITDSDIEQFFYKKLNEIKRKTSEDSEKNHFAINENLIECTIVIELESRQKVLCFILQFNLFNILIEFFSAVS